MPNRMNHPIWEKDAAWLKLTVSGRLFGKTYQGSIPNQKRDTIVATTEDITSGANKFIEKLPTSTKAANKAPAMGAL